MSNLESRADPMTHALQIAWHGVTTASRTRSDDRHFKMQRKKSSGFWTLVEYLPTYFTFVGKI